MLLLLLIVSLLVVSSCLFMLVLMLFLCIVVVLGIVDVGYGNVCVNAVDVVVFVHVGADVVPLYCCCSWYC